MVVQYGEFPLPMSYDDSELDSMIEEFISEKKKTEGCFSYRDICLYLFRTAFNAGKLKKEEDTIYNNPTMTDYDAERVSKLLWCRIWDKKIFINFNEDQYGAHYPNDVRFSII
jgi:hypothetical protein